MPAFHYEALTKSGKNNQGVIEADSERQARQLLRDQGLMPVKLSPVKSEVVKYRRSKLKGSDLALVTRQLATLLSAGIPLEESLRGVSEQAVNIHIRRLLLGVRARVLEGYSLATALQDYPESFSKLYCSTIGAGEQTGRLDNVLEKLADYSEKQQQMRQKMLHAAIYPSIMIFISICIVIFLLTFVVPKMIDVFTTTGQTLPLLTVILIKVSNFFQKYTLYLFVVVIASVYAVRFLLRKPEIRMKWDKWLLQIPVISYLIKTVNTARYIHTFSTLFSSGVSVLETMKASAFVVTNVYMQSLLDIAAVRVKEGSSIFQALKETGLFHPMSLHLISNGEKSGELAPMMERSAMHLDQTVDYRLSTFMSFLEPVIILMMGGVVLFIVLAILLPIFNMQQLVK